MADVGFVAVNGIGMVCGMIKSQADEIEYKVAKYFNWRRNLIVPNVYWGMGFSHECDLFVLTPSNCGWEVEIKVTLYDLKRDRTKKQQHRNRKIRRLYFAVPLSIASNFRDFIPDHAGIIVVGDDCFKAREAGIVSDYKFTDCERAKLMRLAAMRVWTMKKKALAQ